jgi:putative tryptophan/tyrosine transport system substrate-binding protein
MRRLALLFLVLASPAAAQAADQRVYRLGELAPTAVSLEVTRSVTVPELAKLGFREGSNLVLDERVGEADKMEEVARDLLLGNPDAIIAIGPDAVKAASQATRSVPIVMFGSDPVAMGVAASLGRPGGNVTGVAILGVQLDGKRLDLLREAVPTVRKVAALMLPSSPDRAASEAELRGVAASTGIELVVLDVTGPTDYEEAFAAMHAAGARALVIMANPIFYRDSESLARLALQAGIPTVCEWAEMARSGCLLGYGPSRPALRRRVAYFVARIFQGATPGELPIETPTVFEFAINLKTAQALGVIVPPALLSRADEVID